VIVRGIEKKTIFIDTKDLEDFVTLLAAPGGSLGPSWID
jgi:hypothetical protein